LWRGDSVDGSNQTAGPTRQLRPPNRCLSRRTGSRICGGARRHDGAARGAVTVSRRPRSNRGRAITMRRRPGEARTTPSICMKAASCTTGTDSSRCSAWVPWGKAGRRWICSVHERTTHSRTWRSNSSGTNSAYWYSDAYDANSGNGLGVLGKVRWEHGKSPAGQFPANPFGLQDMLANVSEWTEDLAIGPDPASPGDGATHGPPGCTARVVRGGNWTSDPAQSRAQRAGFAAVVFSVAT